MARWRRCWLAGNWASAGALTGSLQGHTQNKRNHAPHHHRHRRVGCRPSSRATSQRHERRTERCRACASVCLSSPSAAHRASDQVFDGRWRSIKQCKAYANRPNIVCTHPSWPRWQRSAKNNQPETQACRGSGIYGNQTGNPGSWVCKLRAGCGSYGVVAQ